MSGDRSDQSKARRPPRAAGAFSRFGPTVSVCGLLVGAARGAAGDKMAGSGRGDQRALRTIAIAATVSFA